MPKKSFVVALTGSIGAGKSTVAKLFQIRFAADVVDADFEAIAVIYELASEVREIFPNCWVDGVFQRQLMQQLAFQDLARLKRREDLVHPIVHERMMARAAAHIDRHRSEGGLVVLDVPLLFESNRHYADTTIVVTAPTDQRRLRVMARSGISEEEFDRRDATQMPQEEKVKLATYHLCNDGSVTHLTSNMVWLLSDLSKAPS
jgi:dephospho-CoA kinase